MPENFFQLLFLFLLLTALFFSVTIAVKVNFYYSVTMTVTVNCHLLFSYFSISVAVTVNWRNTGTAPDPAGGAYSAPPDPGVLFYNSCVTYHICDFIDIRVAC